MTTAAMDSLIQLRFLEEGIVACRSHAGTRVYLRGSEARRRRATPPDAAEREGRDLSGAGVDKTRRLRINTEGEIY